MATSAATANALTGPPADIHEDDFPMLRALAQLQELHDQLNSLRTLLPRRLLAPITSALHPDGTSTSTPPPVSSPRSLSPSKPATSNADDNQSDPHNLFSQLGRVAKEGVEEIEEFKGSWHTPEMEKLWERGRDMSSFSGGQGNDVWDVDYKSLIGKKASVTTLQLKGMEGQDTITAGEKSPRSGEPMDTGLKQDEVDRESEDEDVAQIIEEAKSTYPSLKTNVETPDIISLRVAGMKFKVIRRQEEQPGHPNLSSAWEIQEANPSPGTKSTSSVQQEIIKYINQPNTNKTNHQNKTLQYLLDQISSYSTLKTQPCQTCSKILDPKLRFPVIRRDETPNNNSSSSTSSSSTLPETKSKTHDDKTDNGNGTGKLDNEGEAKTQSITTGIESQHNRNSNRNKSRKWGVYHIGCI